MKRKIPPKNYYTGKSKIHGKGVFAKKDFPAGSLVGKLQERRKRKGFTTLAKNHNHSEVPNSANIEDDKMSRHLVTTKDVKKGEELTIDYRLQPDLEQPEDFGKTSLQNGGVAEKEADKYQFNWGEQPEVGGLTSPVSSILPEKVNYKYSDVGLGDYGKVLAAGPAAPLIFPSETRQIAKSMFVDPAVRLKNKGFIQVAKDLGYTTADIVALGYNQLTNPGPFSSTTLKKAMTETNPITGLPYGEGAESALDVSTYLGLGIGAVAKTGAKQLITKGIPKAISKTKAAVSPKNIKEIVAKKLESEGNLKVLNKIAEVASKNPVTKKAYKDAAFKVASQSGAHSRSGKDIIDAFVSPTPAPKSQYVGNTQFGQFKDGSGRNLIQEYIYGNSKGFTKSHIKHKGLGKYTEKYGDLKTYKLDDSVWGKGPLTMSGKKVNNTGKFRPNQQQQQGLLGKLNHHMILNPKDKYSKILHEALKGFKPGSKGYYKKLGETIKKHKKITISANDGLLGRDDIAGHLITLKHTPKKGFQVETQDIWKFTPEDYGSKWSAFSEFQTTASGQAGLMDKAGKPFVMNDVRPLFLKKHGGTI
jgi:hypothetical protein